MGNELQLASLHRRAGAVLGEKDGWTVPLRYGDPSREHRAAREGAVLADLSAAGRIEATGADRTRFLNGMLTNDVQGLGPGQACRAAFLDAKGRVRSLLTLMAFGDRHLLETPPGRSAETIEALGKYVVSEEVALKDLASESALLLLMGPAAPRVLAQAAQGEALPGPMRHGEFQIGAAKVLSVRTDEFGIASFSLWVRPADGAAVWEALSRAGTDEELKPAGWEALESLRLEAGVPALGRDLGGDVLLPEAGLEDRVSYTKGCYLGQETVARVRHRGHVNRRLRGLVLEGPDPAPPGAAVLSGGREAGRVTSAGWSYALMKPVALALLRTQGLEPGAEVRILSGGSELSARVSDLPLVPSTGVQGR